MPSTRSRLSLRCSAPLTIVCGMSLFLGCGGSSSSTAPSTTTPITPQPASATVTLAPSSTSVTTAQKLSVAISVSGSNGTPSGTVVLSSGSYASAATALVNGAATVVVPAGLLLVGSDTLSATFAPTPASAYTSTTATASVSVTLGPTAPAVAATQVIYPTKGAPFQAIVSPTGNVLVAESGGLEVFAATPGALSSHCLNTLPATLTSEGAAFSELEYLPGGTAIAAGIGNPGAIFYNAANLLTCTGTGVVISQGAISAAEGTQAIAVTPDGKFAFVSNEYGIAAGATLEGNVGVVSLQYDSSGNVSGGTLLGQISTGGQAIAGMLLSPDGTRLYVTTEIAAKTTTAAGASNPVLARTGCVQQAGGTPQINGLLSVISVAQAETSASSSAILATVDAGCSPVRMAETSDNSTLWVAARGDNRVLAFSTGMLESNASNALLGYADTGGSAPVGIALFRNQTLLAIANSNRFGTGANANATILSVAYPAAASVVETIPTGLFPREITAGPDDATLYLTNYSSNTLEVISTH